jgi:methylenetetrahydrofolate dehydrogenase (NADP+) / methenyltetrahydrofolate cyclohydrolase
MTKIIDGKKIQGEILADLKRKTVNLPTKPVLAVVWIGDDPISARYVKIKKQLAEGLGIRFDIYKYSVEVSGERIIKKIKALNSSDTTGVMVQMPLPKNIDRDKVILAIGAKKDVDGLRMCANFDSEILPPVIKAVMLALNSTKVDLKKSQVAIIGQGFLVGSPLAKVLRDKVKKLEVADKETANLAKITKDADVIISAVGKSGLITADLVKEGVVLIDAGTSEVGGELKGDVSPKVYAKSSFYTPVPGGIGTVTVAMLFDNLLDIVEKNMAKNNKICPSLKPRRIVQSYWRKK